MKNKVIDKLFLPLNLLIILLGLVLRFRAFLTGRSLWLDEAMLALNILNRSFGGLFQQPMEYGQSSPIGYVVSVKAFTLILGNSEYALRFYSLLAGCLALILMAVISKDILGKTGSLIALTLFAFNPQLIYYTSETKQYISDVVMTIILLWLLQRQLKIQATCRDFVLLGLAGTLILWFSHPIVFVAGGVGITLFIHYWKNNDRERLLATSLCGLAWGASLIVLYFVNLRHLASSDLLLGYWQEGFLELSMQWFASTWKGYLDIPLATGANAVVVFFLFVIGLVFLFKKNWQIGTAIILTLTLALVASALHKYSLLGRMVLFTAPFFALAASAGMEGIASLFKSKHLALTVQLLLAIYLIWAPFGVSVDEFLHPKFREDIRPTLEYLRDYKKDNDVIYVYYNAGPAFRFYAPKLHLDDSNYIIGNDHSSDPSAYYDELEKLSGEKRVWLLFSHVYEKDDFNEMDYILSDANQIGKKIREFRVSGTSVYLYLYTFQ